MTNLAVTPDRLQVQINYSQTQLFGSSPQFKLVPKNADGTIKDCTGFTTATIAMNLPTAADPIGLTTNPIAVILGDATGIVLGLSVSQATTIAPKLTSAAANASLNATDGTDTMLVGKGTVQLNVLP